jgi:hypothetical protein
MTSPTTFAHGSPNHLTLARPAPFISGTSLCFRKIPTGENRSQLP